MVEKKLNTLLNIKNIVFVASFIVFVLFFANIVFSEYQPDTLNVSAIISDTITPNGTDGVAGIGGVQAEDSSVASEAGEPFSDIPDPTPLQAVPPQTTEIVYIDAVPTSADPGASINVSITWSATSAILDVTGVTTTINPFIYAHNASNGLYTITSLASRSCSTGLLAVGIETFCGGTVVKANSYEDRNFILPKSGDYDFYIFKLNVSDTDGGGEIAVYQNFSQSDLIFGQPLSFQFTSKSNYMPSLNSNSIQNVIASAEVEYEFGGDWDDYNEDINDHVSMNFTLFQPDGSLVDSKLGYVNSSSDGYGFAWVNFSLPVRAQAGNWSVIANYSNEIDSTQQENKFSVRPIINSTYTYAYNGSNPNSYRVFTHIFNRGERITAISSIFNNPEMRTISLNSCSFDGALSGNSSIDSNNQFVECNYTWPQSGINNKTIIFNISLEGIEAVNGDGFSVEQADALIRTNFTIENISTTYNVINKGETNELNATFRNTRGELLDNQNVSIELFTPIFNVQLEGTDTTDSEGLYSFDFTPGKDNESSHLASGIGYNIMANWLGNNEATDPLGFSVTDLLSIINTNSTFDVYNLGEKTYHWGTMNSAVGSRNLGDRNINISLKEALQNKLVNLQSNLTNSAGFFNVSYTLLNSDPNNYSFSGRPYIYDIVDEFNNYYNRTIINDGSIFNVSSRLNLSNQDVGINNEGSKANNRKFNRGEDVYSNQTLYYARGDIYNSISGINIDWMYDTTTITSTDSTDVNGILNFNKIIPINALADHSLNPSFNYSQNISSNGNFIEYDDIFNLSSLYQLSNRSDIINNNVTTFFENYNLGEEVNGSFYLFNVRGDNTINSASIDINITSNSSVQRTISSNSNSSGFSYWNYTILSSDDASQIGEPYHLTAWHNNNNVTSSDEWFVFNFLNITNIWTDKQQEGVDFPTGIEDSSFFIGADVLYVRTHVADIRGNNLEFLNVFSNVTAIGGTLEESRNEWNSSTNSFGWNDWYNVNVIAPAAERNVDSAVNDSSGNFGSKQEVVVYSPSFTGNLNIAMWITDEVGNTGHNFFRGDNLTINALFTKDGVADDVLRNESKITLYYNNASVYKNTTFMDRVSTGHYKYNFLVNQSDPEETYFATVFGIVNGADQYETIFYIVGPGVPGLRGEISHTSTVVAGDPYKAEFLIYDGTGSLTDPDNISVQLIDPVGATLSFDVNLTTNKIGTGRYNFSYLTSGSNTQGWYTTKIDVTDGSLTTEAREQWKLVGGPFDVRDISILDNEVDDLEICVKVENQGEIGQDISMVWNLTRVDSGSLLDSGGDTIFVASKNVNTYCVNPNTSFIGEVRITFVGFFPASNPTEKAGAFEDFSTVGPSGGVSSGSTGGGGQGIRAGEIDIIRYPAKIEIPTNEGAIREVAVRNIGRQDITNLRLIIDGLDSSFYEISPEIVRLSSGEIEVFTIIIDPQDDSGVYPFRFIAEAEEDSEEVSSVLIIDEEPRLSAPIVEIIPPVLPQECSPSFYIPIILIIIILLIQLYVLYRMQIVEKMRKKYPSQHRIVIMTLVVVIIIILLIYLLMKCGHSMLLILLILALLGIIVILTLIYRKIDRYDDSYRKSRIIEKLVDKFKLSKHRVHRSSKKHITRHKEEEEYVSLDSITKKNRIKHIPEKKEEHKMHKPSKIIRNRDIEHKTHRQEKKIEHKKEEKPSYRERAKPVINNKSQVVEKPKEMKKEEKTQEIKKAKKDTWERWRIARENTVKGVWPDWSKEYNNKTVKNETKQVMNVTNTSLAPVVKNEIVKVENEQKTFKPENIGRVVRKIEKPNSKQETINKLKEIYRWEE